MGNLAEIRHLPAKPGDGVQRLLIPIDASEEAHWSLGHAIRLGAAGVAVEVCLVYVAEPVHAWEVLRFRTREEVRRHFTARAAEFLAQAIAELEAAGIPCQGSFREVDTAAGLRELAGELHCSEIVVPHCRWLGVFPYGPWHRLARRAGGVPVIEIGPDGATLR